MKLKHTKVASLAATLITIGSLVGGANAATIHTVIATQDFDSVTVPSPPSDFFTLRGSVNFINSVDISSAADINGTGLGVEFLYDANLFSDEEITLHTFSSVAPGDYFIQFDINAANASFTFESVISDGSTSEAQTVMINTGAGSSQPRGFEQRNTPQITISSASDLSFTMEMSPFVSAFTNSEVFIDNVQLVRVDPVPEPPSTVLLGFGALGLLTRRKRTS